MDESITIEARESADDAARVRLSDVAGLRELLLTAEEQAVDLNRLDARRAEALADAVEYAREHPWIYAFADDATPAATAARCVITEASVRLVLAEHRVRELAATAQTARTWLPLTWRRARDGFAELDHVRAATAFVSRFWDVADAATRAELLAAYDTALAELVLDYPPEVFRTKARRLAARLVRRSPSRDHAAALQQRCVRVERGADGMSTLMLYGATTDLVAIHRRLTAEAKHQRKLPGEDRTRDQLRADRAVALLSGVGTSNGVKTKVFVTVPLDRLTPEARDTVRRDVAPGAGMDLNAEATMLGGEPVDDATARRLLLEAGAFTRVVTDPVTGVILDMDRRSRRVTPAQHAWLLLVHGECVRDGCGRPAVDAEIDHYCAFHGPLRGPTNIANLQPLCEPDHKTKDRTRLRYRRRFNGTLQLISPTGYRSIRHDSRTADEIEADRDDLRGRRRPRSAPCAPLPEQPPF
jgi:hypothetical protein